MITFLSFRGRIGAGKSTAAAYFAKVLLPGAARLSFADALKVEVYDVLYRTRGLLAIRRTEDFKAFGGLKVDATFGLPAPLVAPEDQSEEAQITWVNSNKTALRSFLQFYGTEYRRAEDPEYWIKRFLARAEELLTEDADRPIIVDDCRFENEQAALKALGCQDVWVENAELDSTQDDTHASERMGLMDDTFLLFNFPSAGMARFEEGLANLLTLLKEPETEKEMAG